MHLQDDAQKRSALDVCLTVDLEPDCPPFLWTWRGLEEGAPRLLDLFTEEGVPAAYFVTGETARRYPGAVASLVEAGHELGCHGMTHRAFPDLDYATARWEIEESARLLRSWTDVGSFRAPYLRFPASMVHLLEENGFKLDSSQAKYKASYYRRPSPTSVNLVRIAASMTSSALRLPRWIREPLLGALKSPVVLFVHPWEFVDLTRENLRWDCRLGTGAPALRDLKEVIRFFKRRNARFRTIGSLAEAASVGL